VIGGEEEDRGCLIRRKLLQLQEDFSIMGGKGETVVCRRNESPSLLPGEVFFFVIGKEGEW